jgi:hypothetical protein
MASSGLLVGAVRRLGRGRVAQRTGGRPVPAPVLTANLLAQAKVLRELSGITFLYLTSLTRGNTDTNAKSLRNSCFRDRSEKSGLTMCLSTLFYRLANAPLRTPQV